MVSLDLEGTFGSTQWSILADIIDQPSIQEYLKALLKNYISKRHIGIDFSSGIRWFVAFPGCPQESCLGQLLWSLVAEKLWEYNKEDKNIIDINVI